ncbi:MAG: tRNA (N(6)-L-threonylcarbamoyladenosine(37)-C(2))-methylthiotransferase MtaB [Dehalococcoidia bacterium]|nr:tRNA (N(6)-L-threonylcarbamoyladenosine(37)-C(2))-methylthiotransferase MtaB [Dehalococcoidia bacterium]
MNVYIETHGCKLNISDSQKISDQLQSSGLNISDDITSSDIYILNTCTVTKSADKKARNKLRNIRKSNPELKIVATGCYAERDSEEILNLGVVDSIINNKEKDIFLNKISIDLGINLSKSSNENNINKILLGRTRASVAIQKGCNQICSYCIVPKVRGREKSIEPEEIIQRISYLESRGCKEVVLTGTQLGTYGYDLEDINLTNLLKKILDKTNIERLRLSSVQPHEFNKELLMLWEEKKYKSRLCPHFHIPLQSGSDAILKTMRRKYTTQDFAEIVSVIRNKLENSSITTDLIVGFPGETDKDHNDTKKLLRKLNISDIHVFPYSIRPGTTAYYLKNKIHPSTITSRAKEIREIAKDLNIKHLNSLLTTKQNILWENKRPYSGYTENYSYFKLIEDKSPIDSISQVIIESIDNENNLIGRLS